LDKEGGTYTNAINAYNAAIKLNPKSPLAWQGLAEVYTALLQFRDPPPHVQYSKPMLDLITNSAKSLVEVYEKLLTLIPYANYSDAIVLYRM